MSVHGFEGIGPDYCQECGFQIVSSVSICTRCGAEVKKTMGERDTYRVG